ncbi:uncharacterized protein LOC125090015 isoform X1 [Lutra lutra]|uniref:uncharacterized protein LOC125090015 isoform X1 n=1 Tax=Lutra lutra TaxID=9657 RepID=UPI001FD55A27|nr:uncharacterized protein LOC125090015 isoform X1 [Lutra lutra]
MLAWEDRCQDMESLCTVKAVGQMEQDSAPKPAYFHQVPLCTECLLRHSSPSFLATMELNAQTSFGLAWRFPNFSTREFYCAELEAWNRVWCPTGDPGGPSGRSVNSRCRVSFYMSPRARVEAVAPSALLFIDKFAFHHHAAEFPQIFADTWRFFISSVITLLASLPRSGPAGGNNSCWGFRVPQKPHLISALQGLLSPKSRKTLLHSRQERTI